MDHPTTVPASIFPRLLLSGEGEPWLGPLLIGESDRVRLPLTRREARLQLACTLRELGHRVDHLLPVVEGGSLPMEFARWAPALLVWHATDIAAGGEGLRLVWTAQWEADSDESTVMRRRDPFQKPRATVRPGVGWVFRLSIDHGCTVRNGPETGEEGKAAADRAALSLGIALIDADGLRLPERA